MRDVTLSLDGVPIHYEVHGQGTPALVFVHGWSCDRSYWRKQLEHFASRFTVVTIDLAGHGESGLNRESWTMAAFGADVAAVVEHLGLTSVILIGHSMGGPVVVEAAKRMPRQAIGLIGVDTMKNLDIIRTQEQMDKVLSPFHEDFVQAADAFARRIMFVETSAADFRETIIQDMASAPPHVAIGALEKLFGNGANLQASLQEVHAPIVLINSDISPTNMKAAGRYGIRLMTMSGVGHFVMLEDAETFNRLLEDAVRMINASALEK